MHESSITVAQASMPLNKKCKIGTVMAYIHTETGSISRHTNAKARENPKSG